MIGYIEGLAFRCKGVRTPFLRLNPASKQPYGGGVRNWPKWCKVFLCVAKYLALFSKTPLITPIPYGGV